MMMDMENILMGLLLLCSSGVRAEEIHHGNESVRLVGSPSRCRGTVQFKHNNEWRGVLTETFHWILTDPSIFCRKADCGSAVSLTRDEKHSDSPIWLVTSDCLTSKPLASCVTPEMSPNTVWVTCSDLLVQSNISASSSVDGVSEAEQQEFHVTRGSNFTVSCSIKPQFPGGSFVLTFASSDSALNYTQPAVDHSANFLFPAAEPAHQGNYSCIYELVFHDHNFSSESRQLSLTVSD